MPCRKPLIEWDTEGRKPYGYVRMLGGVWFPDGVAEQGLSLAQVFYSAALAGKAAAAADLTGRPAEQGG